MAIGAKCNHVARVVWTLIGQLCDVVNLQVRPALLGQEGGAAAAELTNPTTASQCIKAYGFRPDEGLPCSTKLAPSPCGAFERQLSQLTKPGFGKRIVTQIGNAR